MSATPFYLRWLWWKHTWTFQAAHKPLCGRFRRDVLRFGSLRVCRSCAALYSSIGVALLTAPMYYAHLSAQTAAMAGGILLAIVVASAPTPYQHAPRALRDVLRAGLGVLIGVAVVLLFTPMWLWGAGQLGVLALAWRAYHRQRDDHTNRHDLCEGCAECGRDGICSGFVEQASHLRAYEEAATDWLESGEFGRRMKHSGVDRGASHN